MLHTDRHRVMFQCLQSPPALRGTEARKKCFSAQGEPDHYTVAVGGGSNPAPATRVYHRPTTTDVAAPSSGASWPEGHLWRASPPHPMAKLAPLGQIGERNIITPPPQALSPRSLSARPWNNPSSSQQPRPSAVQGHSSIPSIVEDHPRPHLRSSPHVAHSSNDPNFSSPWSTSLLVRANPLLWYLVY